MPVLTLQTVAYYTAQSQAAVAYVKSRMTDGADNNIWDLITSGFDSRSCVRDMRASYNTPFSKRLSISEQAKIRAIWAETSGCGNCGEQSAVAYEWLRKHGVQPVEWMLFSNKDHAFVVLGRDPASSVGKVAGWGPKAVICDPWKNDTYPATMMNRYWPGAIPMLWPEPA